MQTITETMINWLERLAEMFPGDSYQYRFEQYLNRYNVDNVAQIEHLQRQFDRDIIGRQL